MMDVGYVVQDWKPLELTELSVVLRGSNNPVKMVCYAFYPFTEDYMWLFDSDGT